MLGSEPRALPGSGCAKHAVQRPEVHPTLNETLKPMQNKDPLKLNDWDAAVRRCSSCIRRSEPGAEANEYNA